MNVRGSVRVCQTVRRFANEFVTKEVREYVRIYFRRCVKIDVRTRIREIVRVHVRTCKNISHKWL